MSWTAPFVIYRINNDAKLEEVFHAADLKKAKYWLTYIAQPGDVLCKTPAHPKHSKQKNIAEYWSHKDHMGRSLSSEEAAWNEYAKSKQFDFAFPETQIHFD